MAKSTKSASSRKDKGQSAYTATLEEISRLVPKEQIDSFVSAYGPEVGLQKAKEMYQKRIERGGETGKLERESEEDWENKYLRSLSIREIVHRGNNGDLKEVISILYDRYHHRLRNFIWGFVKEDNIADEITQDTFVRVQEKLSTYRDTYEFSTWIYTIGGNLAKNYLRRQKKELDVIAGSVDDIENAEEMFTDQKNIPSTKGLALDKAIDNLPQRYREAFELRYIQDYPYEDIAQMLGIPIGTVKSRVNRARETLMQKLSVSIMANPERIS
ncbi:sigma-70 family RNA polymerase sigma factor [Candidatus Pacearchaeota archaeon]|nr:sigma-70 family RNA polymerase sigma factor [Candidatus Pacearchaeota archaeon]